MSGTRASALQPGSTLRQINDLTAPPFVYFLSAPLSAFAAWERPYIQFLEEDHPQEHVV